MITITYISRNCPVRLKNSIKSLFNQTILPEHIVVTDCSDNKASIEDVIGELKNKSSIPITFVWRPKEELSRAQGRNLGREYVKTPIAVSTESDILFPPNIIEETLIEFGNPARKKYLQTYFITQEEDGTEKKHNNCNAGFYQTYRTEDFDNIGGYNPFLTGWGFEDDDFSKRIIGYGCRHVILPLYVKHQWHVSRYNIENNWDKNFKMSNESYWDNKKKQWLVK